MCMCVCVFLGSGSELDARNHVRLAHFKWVYSMAVKVIKLDN